MAPQRIPRPSLQKKMQESRVLHSDPSLHLQSFSRFAIGSPSCRRGDRFSPHRLLLESLQKKEEDRQRGLLFLAISQRVSGIMNQFVKNQSLGILGFERVMDVNERKHELKEMHEGRREYEDEPVQQQLKKTVLMPEETLSADTVESPGFSIIASSVGDSMSSRESEVTGFSSPPFVITQTGVPQPLLCMTDIPKQQFDGYAKENEFVSELHALIANAPSSEANGLVYNVQLEVDDYKRPFCELSEADEIISYGGIFKESGREGLYTFCKANQSAVKSKSKLNGLKTLSSHASLQDKNTFSSQMRKSTTTGVKLSNQDFNHTAETIEGKIPLACYEGSSPRESTDFGRSRSFLREERRILPQDGRRYILQPSHPNGIHVDDKNYPSRQMSAYNCLLKDGRYGKKGFVGYGQGKAPFTLCFVLVILHYYVIVANLSNYLVSGAFEVMRLVQEAGLKADCKLYTTLISTCAKSGKVDAMFKVFHEMVNAEVEPNVHTYGALIDGCAKAGQVAKAFGAYGIMRSKKVKPDRVVFNALITACGQSGAVDRAFDVLAEMTTETQPIDPDQVTIGALIKACANVGQVDRARDAYNMIDQYHIKGTPEVYTIAVNSCSQTGDWEFACSVYRDMKRKGVIPDEMFLSALIDVAGHAGKVCAAFETLQEARKQGIHIGSMSYSSLMGACSNAKNWQKALELYEDIKSITLKPTVSTMNALITALCDGDQLPKALEVFSEMKRMAMCLRRFEKACALDEPVISFNSGRPQIDSKWTSLALMVYRETIVAGVVPTMELFSQLLGCLQLPHDASLKNRLIENLEVSTDSPRRSNLCSLVDGFGEYDPRAFSLFEEAASLGIVPCVSFKESPIVVDARKLQIHTAEVLRLPNTTILLPTERTQVQSPAGEKTIYLAASLDNAKIHDAVSDSGSGLPPKLGATVTHGIPLIGQVVAALLRRLGLQYLGHESYGKIRIHGVAVKRWFKPKLSSPFSGKSMGLSLLESRLGKGISNQQRNIRIGNYFLD
ncbi:pentatricopeptide repeat (PPR) superfamily protein [Actinidia rufa]|uniref:Pentatricopeptide repeat (PPR) superfamily protein n=1 Tax=Actinidia rufa TaxID=165716 RepID=A0A7J0FNW3_9ERIC|nr:pentatricopeptide repeat (PPR) superfamily protein [Actinidia rufa]